MELNSNWNNKSSVRYKNSKSCTKNLSNVAVNRKGCCTITPAYVKGGCLKAEPTNTRVFLIVHLAQILAQQMLSSYLAGDQFVQYSMEEDSRCFLFSRPRTYFERECWDYLFTGKDALLRIAINIILRYVGMSFSFRTRMHIRCIYWMYTQFKEWMKVQHTNWFQHCVQFLSCQIPVSECTSST